MSMNSHPVRALPAISSHGNPPASPIRSPHVLPAPRPGLRDPRQRPVIGQPQGAADRGIARRRAEDRLQLAQHLDFGHGRGAHCDRDRRGRQHHAPAELRGRPLHRQRRVEFRGQAALVGELAQQDPARVPDQPVSLSSDLQGMTPGRILHREERSGPEITWRGNP